MKAFIVAAGLGTRLRPLTDNVPKCMIPIGGHPLLWYHVQLLKYYGITDIWINTHWLADQVTSYFKDGSSFGVKINYSYENPLLGTSGALKNASSGVVPAFANQTFLITYGDNFTNMNLKKFIDFHHRHPKSVMTIAAQPNSEPWTKGVITTDDKLRIIDLVEKPPRDTITSNLTNAGVYICTPKVLSSIPNGFSDFGQHVIPNLIKSKLPLYCYQLTEYLADTGTSERYATAQKEASTLNFPFQVQ